jgi:hypothetical protein
MSSDQARCHYSAPRGLNINDKLLPSSGGTNFERYIDRSIGLYQPLVVVVIGDVTQQYL